MKFVILMATTKDEREAKTIAKALLDKRLAACCNIVPSVRSMFWWEGRQEEVKESLMIIKTRRERAAEAARELKAMHSYKVPSIEFLEIVGGSSEYLKWVEKETTLTAQPEKP
jgi:periplasmic divalent cation tolerance protein